MQEAYCPLCHSIMSYNDQLDKYEYNCLCYDNIVRKRILLWCDECKKLTSRQGVKPTGKCSSCIVKLQHKKMQEMDPLGYSKRQQSASIKAHQSMKEHGTGLYDSNVRSKIEETKKKNGTYDKLTQSAVQWRKDHPEDTKRIAQLGGIATAKKVKAMTSDEKMEWVKRSCNNETANAKKSLSKAKNTGIRYCLSCQEETFHLNGMCTRCHPSSGVGRHIASEKAKEMRSLAKNPLPSFMIKNDILHYFDHSQNQYVPWEDYKAKFSRKRTTKNMETFITSLRSIKGLEFADIKLVPTFRDQDSDSWVNKRSAFEKSLVDEGIEWFAYIKFYINAKENSIRPIVVGKTGSLIVNSSGTDVSFSIDSNDGPARLFLHETKQEWDKTQILIIKAKSERQALFFEWKIVKVFDLFKS